MISDSGVTDREKHELVDFTPIEGLADCRELRKQIERARQACLSARQLMQGGSGSL
ncbi:MAG TPA: hypothetical protein VL918_06980 [Sphingobium sp.]|nr:hypothetical protein [Sphingobium sp.]